MQAKRLQVAHDSVFFSIFLQLAVTRTTTTKTTSQKIRHRSLPHPQRQTRTKSEASESHISGAASQLICSKPSLLQTRLLLAPSLAQGQPWAQNARKITMNTACLEHVRGLTRDSFKSTLRTPMVLLTRVGPWLTHLLPVALVNTLPFIEVYFVAQLQMHDIT